MSTPEGYPEYTEGCLVHQGDTILSVGDIMSTGAIL